MDGKHQSFKEGDQVTLIDPNGKSFDGVVLAPFYGEMVIKAGGMTGYLSAFVREGYSILERESNG